LNIEKMKDQKIAESVNQMTEEEAKFPVVFNQCPIGELGPKPSFSTTRRYVCSAQEVPKERIISGSRFST